VVKWGQSKHFREVGKKVIEESMRLDNTRTLRQIVEDVLKKTINDISQIDLNGVVKTAVSGCQTTHKKEPNTKPYLYEIPELGERFEYIVVENTSSCLSASSQRVGDKMEYPEPSSEIVLELLKKFKDGNKAGDNKADDDALAQKLAEKWIREARIYVKKLFDTTYADKGEHLIKNAYYQSFLNALDKQEESIRLKLSSLFKEISEVDIEYRDSMYKLVTKKRYRAMSLEQYLTSYYLDECKLLADF
ncbi:4592_t:CDS:2, partial [Rhizophagus irregularis]